MTQEWQFQILFGWHRGKRNHFTQLRLNLGGAVFRVCDRLERIQKGMEREEGRKGSRKPEGGNQVSPLLELLIKNSLTLPSVDLSII